MKYAFFVSLILLASCTFSFTNDVSKKLPDNVQSEVDRLNEATIKKDWDEVFKSPHSALQDDLNESTFKILERFVEGDEIRSGEVVSVSRKTSTQLANAQTTYDIVYRLESDSAVMMITYGLLEDDGCCELYNYRLNLEELFEDDADEESEEENKSAAPDE